MQELRNALSFLIFQLHLAVSPNPVPVWALELAENEHTDWLFFSFLFLFS